MEGNVKILLDTIRDLEYKLSAVQQLVGFINVAGDLKTTCARVLEHLLKLSQAEAALLVIIRAEGIQEMVMVRGGKIIPPAISASDLEARLMRDFQSGLSGVVLKSREAVIVPDTRADARFRHEICQSFGYAASSAMALPLSSPRGSGGVLTLFNKGPDGAVFTPADVSLTSSVSSLVTILVDNAQLFSDVDRRISELNNLIRANELINSSLELDTVLDTIILLGMRVIDAEAGSILLMDPEKNQLYFAAASGVKKEEVKRVYLHKGEGIAGWVVDHGKPLLIPDVTKDSRFTQKVDQASGFVTKSILAVPLIVEGQVIGVVEAINKNDGSSFTERDTQLLKTLSVTSALAIQKARMFGNLHGLFVDTVGTIVSAVEAKDTYGHAHTERVRRLSVELAEALGMEETEVYQLERTVLLSEIGRLRANPEDPSWREKVPLMSAELIGGVKALNTVSLMIRHVLERWDGNGRPDGLAKEAIPLGSRIMAVAKAYDRFTTDQPDRPALSPEKALEELSKRSGTEFDPQCVSAFKAMHSLKFTVHR